MNAAARAAALPGRLFSAVKRAFGEFLALPVLVVAVFVGLAVALYVADDTWSQGGNDPYGWLSRLLGDAGSLGSLLSTVASSIITVTSITFSLLLIALQQGSSALTAQVTDQFLMRRANQFYFGYFVGLSIYVLMTLVTVSSVHLPVLGTAAALLLTAVALCMIVVMIYNTIDQMRPAQIVRAIRGHVVRARQREREWLAETRRTVRPGFEPLTAVGSEESGHVARIDLGTLRKALAEARPEGDLEIEIAATIGSFVAYRDPLAHLRIQMGAALDFAGREALAEAVHGAFKLEDGRDLTCDPSYGLTQLATIGWTSVSTAKSNPSPGLAVVETLRDVIARWEAEGPAEEDLQSPVVCADGAMIAAIDALELIGVVSSESIQSQTVSSVLRSVAMLLPSASDETTDALVAVVRRSLSALGEHVPTRELMSALGLLEAALGAAGQGACAEDVGAATRDLALCIGRLNSRSTRVPGTKQT